MIVKSFIIGQAPFQSSDFFGEVGVGEGFNISNGFLYSSTCPVKYLKKSACIPPVDETSMFEHRSSFGTMPNHRHVKFLMKATDRTRFHSRRDCVLSNRSRIATSKIESFILFCFLSLARNASASNRVIRIFFIMRACELGVTRTNGKNFPPTAAPSCLSFSCATTIFPLPLCVACLTGPVAQNQWMTCSLWNSPLAASAPHMNRCTDSEAALFHTMGSEHKLAPRTSDNFLLVPFSSPFILD